MVSSHDRLLARYLEATTEIARSPHCEVSPSINEKENAHKESLDKGDSSSQDKDFQDGSGPAAAAMTELLSRQARVVMTLHNVLTTESDQPHNVDEDLLKHRIRDLISISTSKFYSYRFDLLPAIWRQIYTDSIIMETHHLLLRPLTSKSPLPEETLDLVVEKLDRALITAGGAGKSQWIEKTLEMLEETWSQGDTDNGRPCKRQRKDTEFDRSFSIEEPHGRPKLNPERACPRYSGWTMEQFEDYMNANNGMPRPIVFTDLIQDWPALTDHPWKSPDYLLSKTFGGRRLVPVEIGRSYVDDGWGQELIQFRTFISRYIDTSSQKVGYLAQHNLFQQIPSLRNDIQVPDFCWVDVPPHPTNPALDQPTVSVPQLNAWFGPAKTITPLHTDGYHNLLCQAVGTKYLRLYPPQATPSMRPRASELGVDMSNTSGLDVGVLEGWDERPEDVSEEDVEAMKKELEGVEYWECILEPGDTLVIPIGWWHYVRSLSVSFSVSFWWN